MKEIKLTKGLLTLVDDDLYEELKRWRWYAQGHAGRPARRISIPKRTIIYMYHQILEVWPWELREKGLEVDHIDRNPLNNQKENLRIVPHYKNMQNSITSLKRVGVGRDNTHNTYKAYIDQHDRKRINIGTFKTYEEALLAVKLYQEGL